MKMKKNEINEILALGAPAISGKITELKKSLALANLDLKRGKLKDLRTRRTIKSAIAKLKTHLSQGVK